MFDVESTNVTADLLRVFTVFVPAAIIMGYVVLVIIAYFKAYRVERYKRARTGLLPHHVWLIGISYLLLIIDEILVVFERKSEEFTIHSWLLIPAFITGVLALNRVLKYERLRYKSTRQINADIDHPNEQV